MTTSYSSHRSTGGTNVRDGLLYLLVGGGIGAGLALLFAPKSGVELRSDMSEITRKGYDETLEVAQNLKERSEEFYQSIKETADRAYQLAATRLSLAEDKTNETVDIAGEVINGEIGKAANKGTRGSGPTCRAANIV